jgi:hypothetical protein
MSVINFNEIFTADTLIIYNLLRLWFLITNSEWVTWGHLRIYVPLHTREANFTYVCEKWHQCLRREPKVYDAYSSGVCHCKNYKCLLVPSPGRKHANSECYRRKLLVRTLPILNLSNTNIPCSNSLTCFNFQSASPASGGETFLCFRTPDPIKGKLHCLSFLQHCTAHQTKFARYLQRSSQATVTSRKVPISTF